MIFITGDCHGKYERFDSEAFPEQRFMTKNDFVIVCGDFGIWNHSKKREGLLDELDSLPFTVLFVDGNHENFDILNSLPAEWWKGGLVHKVRPSVIHLMRGQSYRIEGKTFFTFGGARSHDIDDGILSPYDYELIKEYRENDARFRINHLSWWKEEIPSIEEMEAGFETLNMMDGKIDYILTHEAPVSSIQELCGERARRFLVRGYGFPEYLQYIKDTVEYKKWFFGHYHVEKSLSDECECIYKTIKPLP